MKVEVPEGQIIEIQVSGKDVLVLETDEPISMELADRIKEIMYGALADPTKRVFVLGGGMRLRVLHRDHNL